MATAAQVTANRANALHSTGPLSQAGKSASSQNATRHSLAVKGLVILPGQEDAFAQLHTGLRASLKPATALQEVIFKRLVECAWKIERCRIAEEVFHLSISASATDPMLDPYNMERFTAIQKYAREAENSLYKAIRELGKLQTESQFRAQSAALEPVAPTPPALSELSSLAQVMKNLRANFQSGAKTEHTGAASQADSIDSQPSIASELLAPSAKTKPKPPLARTAAA